MKKIIAVLLSLCLLSGLCAVAAAEEDADVLDFPVSSLLSPFRILLKASPVPSIPSATTEKPTINPV